MEANDKHPRLCVNSCGFFGNVATADMCSSCSKQFEQSKKHLSAAAATTATTTATPLQSASMTSTSEATITETLAIVQPIAAAEAVLTPKDDSISIESLNGSDQIPTEQSSTGDGKDDAPKEIKMERRDRCFNCRAKVSIAKQITNLCRCDHVFCDQHRTPAHHNCEFDHQALQKTVLEKQNVKMHDKKSGGRSFTRLE